MEGKVKISLPTKWLSNRHYLNEIPIEGKKSPRFFKIIGFYDAYCQQIIRSGNCLTLLSSQDPMTANNFWNLHHFEHNCKFVFFTFNKSFLVTLINQINFLQGYQVDRALELLNENPEAWSNAIQLLEDEEVQFCLLKLNYIRKSQKYDRMFLLDRSNRKMLMEALLRKKDPEATVNQPPVKVKTHRALFPNMLQVFAGKAPEDTISFIRHMIKEADFPLDPFIKVTKVGDGRNPYKLNYQIAAMLDFFIDKNYFQPQHTRKEIFQAFQDFTQNYIGKFDTFLSQCVKNTNYKDFKEKLKILNISKFN